MSVTGAGGVESERVRRPAPTLARKHAAWSLREVPNVSWHRQSRFWSWITGIRARKRACVTAVVACRDCQPTEPILGSIVYAEEGGRAVVRFFVGHRQQLLDELRRPTWRGLLIFAVPKNGAPASLLLERRAYRPTIR